MWTPGLVCPMFCNSVAPLMFPQDPHETGETRDDQPQSIIAVSHAGNTSTKESAGSASGHIVIVLVHFLGHANRPPSRKHRWQTSICVWCWCQHHMGGSVGSF